MRRYGVTFHDAAYHGTAIVEDGLFVTADAHKRACPRAVMSLWFGKFAGSRRA
jgi:hypothetical protein